MVAGENLLASYWSAIYTSSWNVFHNHSTSDLSTMESFQPLGVEILSPTHALVVMAVTCSYVPVQLGSWSMVALDVECDNGNTIECSRVDG